MCRGGVSGGWLSCEEEEEEEEGEGRVGSSIEDQSSVSGGCVCLCEIKRERWVGGFDMGKSFYVFTDGFSREGGGKSVNNFPGKLLLLWVGNVNVGLFWFSG